MAKPESQSPSARTLYMRKWRERHPENKEYQQAYQQQYLSDPEKRAAANRRASDWNQQHRDKKLAYYRERYNRIKQLKGGKPSGERHHAWKGEFAGYLAMHAWVRRHKGAPITCSNCGKTGKMQWANKDHKYKRKLDDYISLCASCHYWHDVNNGLRPPSSGVKKSV